MQVVQCMHCIPVNILLNLQKKLKIQILNLQNIFYG